MDAQLAQLRQNYQLHSLDIGDVEKNPFVQMRKWLDEAIKAEVPEANAMYLSTVSKEGKPSGRIMLLKGLEDDGLVFFSNYLSRKGEEMESNKFVSLTFFWKELERQVRVEGSVTKINTQESLEYFQSRPRESQIGAWVSPQSSVIAGRDFLEKRFSELEKEFAGKNIPKPEHWGGYKVGNIEHFEFWQGRPSRLHDRIVYENKGKDWAIYRLAP